MHHDDTPNIDPRHDITDLYAFQKPGEPTSSVLILNVYPEAPTRSDAFDPQASYEIKIDTNGDFEADIAFHVRFAFDEPRAQTATVYRATGADAQATGAAGEVLLAHAPLSLDHDAHVTSAGPYRFFAGLRSDPFFADRDGFSNNLQWTGQDYFADKNVYGIVLEVPNHTFGDHTQLNIWGQTMVRVHDTFRPANVAGRPGNHVFRPDSATFQATQPAQQRDRFLSHYARLFQQFGYSEAEATELALEWLPDVLRYDYSRTGGFPNGRQLTDDVATHFVRIMTRGTESGGAVAPHGDLLAEFPYLGPPH
jgi:hypothetical protein